MEEKVLSETQLTALKDLVRPKLLGLIPTTPPSVDKRKDFLRANPSIPIDDSNRKLIMGILGEGLKEFEKSELDRSIALLHKERMVQDFLKSSPTVDERLEFILNNQLTGGPLGEQTFNLMREGLNDTQLNQFIEKLIMKELKRSQSVQKSTNLREHSIFSTAIKFAVFQENKGSPYTAQEYIKDPFNSIRNFNIPTSLLAAASEMDSANIIFSMISAPLQNESNRNWEKAKNGPDKEQIISLESTFKAIAATSNKLKKITNDTKDPNKKDGDDVKKYVEAADALSSKLHTRVVSQNSNNETQPQSSQEDSKTSTIDSPRKERSDRTLRGAMKVSAENLKSALSSEEIAGMDLSPRTTTQSQKTPESSAGPTASTSGSEKTSPRSPRERKIGTHRPPLPEHRAPSPPASPRGEPMIGMQRKQSAENLAAKSGTTSDSEKTPPPSPRGEPMIGMQRKKSTENLAATSDSENIAPSRPRRGAIIDRQLDNSNEALPESPPSSPRKEKPASDNIQLASSSDIERLRKQVAEVKAKAKALESRVAETRQDYKSLKDQRREVNKLDTEIGELEAQKEAVKTLREAQKAKIAQHREKNSQQQLTGSHPEGKDSLPPQVKDMMTKSKVQQEKAEKIADAADAAKTNPRHSTPSRGSERR